MEGKKIFIIEDDANILYGLQAKFRVENFEVKTSIGNVSEEELIKDLIIFKPNFIILDLILPKISGFKMSEKIKAEESLADSLIFVFSSLSDRDSRKMGEDLGIKYYFIKNEFNLDEFTEKIIKIVNNREKI